MNPRIGERMAKSVLRDDGRNNTIKKRSQESRAAANESLASTEALGAEAVSSLHAESSDLAANIDAHTRRSAGLEKDVARSTFSSVRRVGSAFRKETRTRLLSTAGRLTGSAS